MNFLWDLNINESTTDESLKFLKEQAEALEGLTGGNVKAIFGIKRSNGLTGLSKTLKELSKSANKSRSANDASELYNCQTYEFYITDKNLKYELELFTLYCNDLFPMIINIDETISKEAFITEKLTILNNERLIEIFSNIIRTNKVKYVINKLIEMVDESEKK